MRTNKISQNHLYYQTSFQRRLVDSTVPPIIADAVKKAPNIKTILKQYRIRLVNYNTTEDTHGRPVLHLNIKFPKKIEDLLKNSLYDFWDLFSSKPKEKVKYKRAYTAADNKGLIRQIEELTVADIERIIKQTQDDEMTALKGTPPEGVRTF